MATDLDTLIERKLRSLDKPLKTNDLVKQLAPGHDQGPTPAAVYKRLLALAPLCPAASKDTGHSFVRYGRTCFPWVWRRLLDGEALMLDRQEASRLARGPVVYPSVLTLSEADFDEIERRILGALSKKEGLILATVGEETAAPDTPLACAICGTESESLIYGVCPKCDEEPV